MIPFRKDVTRKNSEKRRKIDPRKISPTMNIEKQSGQITAEDDADPEIPPYNNINMLAKKLPTETYKRVGSSNKVTNPEKYVPNYIKAIESRKI